MLIGIDFDNTIVSYDALFHREAVTRGMSDQVPATKDAVRDHLRARGHEEEWTRLQGYVYGRTIGEAPPFPNAIEFFRNCRRIGVELCIISHRTRHPVLGPQFDLHQAAFDWLRRQGLIDAASAPLSGDRVYFEETKEQKLERIAAVGCTHFVDDLPEFLSEPGFPPGVARILFAPHGGTYDRCAAHGIQRVGSWNELGDLVAQSFDPSRK